MQKMQQHTAAVEAVLEKRVVSLIIGVVARQIGTRPIISLSALTRGI
jgi:hypothetical protein